MDTILSVVIILLIAIFFIIALLAVVLVLSDDVEEIDNSEGKCICPETNLPCVKTMLYTKVDNCANCLVHRKL